MNDRKNATVTISHKIATAIGIILCIILIPMLIFNITLIVKGFINPDKVPSVFGYSPLIVQSGSMEVQIHTGDVVVVKGVDVSTLKAGDIVAFKSGDVVVTHRIAQVETSESGETVYITKGDANNTVDQNPVTQSQIVGIYLFRIGEIGDLAMFMQTPIGMVCFVGVPVILFILYDVLRRRHYDKKEKALKNSALV